MLTPFRVAILLGIAAIVAGITSYLYIQMVQYEDNVALNSFKGRFGSYGPEFVATWSGKLLPRF